LEHIQAHQTVLDWFFRVLEPGGRLVLLVPAHPALFGTLDVALGHVRRYSKSELFDLLARTGFVVEHHSYLNLFGILGWWLNGKVLKRRILPQRQLDLYEKLVPVFAWLECLMGQSLGLSHVIVGQKPVSGDKAAPV
jgi:ubiquinone/menaquinone biosynthesis C-methylase UbiE